MLMADSRYIPRTLDIAGLSRRKSLFLFGPRQTGKTALIRHALPSAKVYDLLDGDVFRTLSHRPARLGEELESGDRLVVVDGIQKLPELLDEVHRLIERRSIHFVLTGSSARKLRRGGVNLLGGRAPTRTLHPFTYRELGDEFVLERALDRGLLPSIYFSTDPKADLGAYVGAYLREEVAAEALTRNVPAFSRFLEVAALCHGTMLNFSQIASDAQTPVSTVREYFHILEDTLVARLVSAWTRTRTRKAIATAKYYFFDCGVVRRLQHRAGLARRSPEFGAKHSRATSFTRGFLLFLVGKCHFLVGISRILGASTKGTLLDLLAVSNVSGTLICPTSTPGEGFKISPKPETPHSALLFVAAFGRSLARLLPEGLRTATSARTGLAAKLWPYW